MGFLAGRDGKISIFRVGIIAAVLGVLLIGFGVLSVALDNNSYRSPLDIPPFPGSEACGVEAESSVSRSIFYCIPGVPPEPVAQYYTQKLTEHNGTNDEICTRIPVQGNYPNADVPGAVPYEFKCAFNRSGIGGGFQSTVVTIQPGIFNADPALNTEGQTIVRYEQRWEP